MCRFDTATGCRGRISPQERRSLPRIGLTGGALAEAPELIFAHGWAHSHASLAPLAQAMGRVRRSASRRFPWLWRVAVAARCTGAPKTTPTPWRNGSAGLPVGKTAHLGWAFVRLPGRIAARRAPSGGGGRAVPDRHGGAATASFAVDASATYAAAPRLQDGAGDNPGGSGARPAARALRQKAITAPPARCARCWSRRSARI